MSSTRSVISPPPFAANALTVIPPTPVAGVSYRDPIAGPASSADGWPYAERVNSAEWNQIMYQVSSLLAIMDKKGVLGWSSDVDYSEASIAFGSDGLLYNWLQPSGPSLGGAKDPAAGANPLYWKAAITSIPDPTDVVSGSALNLKSSTVGTNAVAVFTADEFVVKNSTGAIKKLSGVSISVNGAVSGLNGLDTGALAANTWYYLHVIYNPTTLAVGGVLSLNSVLPTVLPSGYTYSAYASTPLRVGATNTRFLPMANDDGVVFWRPAAGTDMPSDVPVLLNAGTSTAAAAVSIQAFAPPTAKTAKLGLTVSGGTSAKGEVYLGSGGTSSGMLAQAFTNGVTTLRVQFDAPSPFANGVHYAIANPGSVTIVSIGFEE